MSPLTGNPNRCIPSIIHQHPDFVRSFDQRAAMIAQVLQNRLNIYELQDLVVLHHRGDERDTWIFHEQFCEELQEGFRERTTYNCTFRRDGDEDNLIHRAPFRARRCARLPDRAERTSIRRGCITQTCCDSGTSSKTD